MNNTLEIGQLRKLYWPVYRGESDFQCLINWACMVLEFLETPNDHVTGLAMSSSIDEALLYSKALIVQYLGDELANEPILPLMHNYLPFDTMQFDCPLGDRDAEWEFQHGGMLVYIPKSLNLSDVVIREKILNLLKCFHGKIPDLIQDAARIFAQQHPSVIRVMKFEGLDDVFLLIYSVELDECLQSCSVDIGINYRYQYPDDVHINDHVKIQISMR